jgi:hypothetical protein
MPVDFGPATGKRDVMALRRGRPRKSDRNSFSLEDERAWYRRGVDAYLETCYRERSRASASEFAQEFGIRPPLSRASSSASLERLRFSTSDRSNS